MADDAYIAALRRIILEIHGCPAEYLETIVVREMVAGNVVWEGDVEVFGVPDHPRSHKCYAWVPDRTVRGQVRFFAVLESALIRTALDAVKFARISFSADLIEEFSRTYHHT